jgi:hypothetical protein
METYNINVEEIVRFLVKRSKVYIMNRYDSDLHELDVWLTMYGVPFFTELYIDSVKEKFNMYMNDMINIQLENAAKHLVYSTSAFILYHSNGTLESYEAIKYLTIVIKQQFEQFHTWCDMYAVIYNNEHEVLA